MVKKIRTAAFFLIIIILISAFSGIAVLKAKEVDGVDKVQVVKQGMVDSCEISWNKVSGANGYYIYAFNQENEKFEKIANVEDGKTLKYILKDLTPSTIYRLKVQAYKNFRDTEYTGDMSSECKIYTSPSQVVVDANSVSAGVMAVNWQNDAAVSGYEIQYSPKKEFDEKETSVETVDDPNSNTYDLKGLEEQKEYFVRVRGYFAVDEKTTAYAEWSEIQSATIAKTVKLPDHIDPNKPMLALSFDDGPAFNSATKRILDTLEKYGARATFYMVGSRISKSTKVHLDRQIKLGCELGNHTYDHKRYGKKVTASDISKCSDVIFDAVGQRPTSFRCPGGNMSSTIQKQAKKENMMIAHWTVDTQDWKSKDAKKIYNRATKLAYDGCIILMHDIYEPTADAVEKIVPALIEQGYQLVTVSELIQAKTGKPAKAGQQYLDYKTINNNTN